MFNIPIDNVYSLVYYYFIKTYILHNKERRNILQPLLTNVKEYSLEDIANLLPIGVQQIAGIDIACCANELDSVGKN